MSLSNVVVGHRECEREIISSMYVVGDGNFFFLLQSYKIAVRKKKFKKIRFLSSFFLLLLWWKDKFFMLDLTLFFFVVVDNLYLIPFVSLFLFFLFRLFFCQTFWFVSLENCLLYLTPLSPPSGYNISITLIDSKFDDEFKWLFEILSV